LAPSVPYLPEPELRRRAADFLAHFNPKSEIPVPIERIIEFDIGLDIVPVPGLMDTRGINGFLTSDRTSIYVDETLLRKGAKRYFFTLAHELAHFVLHEEHYRKFSSGADWKSYHAALEISAIASAEWQADTFAGLVLVPSEALESQLKDHFRRLSAKVRSADPGFDLSGEAFWRYVAEELGKIFMVSTDTARIRLENDQLWRKLSR
jgi:Zn-dependent peptidase ImmA (M78 family)